MTQRRLIQRLLTALNSNSTPAAKNLSTSFLGSYSLASQSQNWHLNHNSSAYATSAAAAAGAPAKRPSSIPKTSDQHAVKPQHSILKDVSSTSLSQAHVGNYYPLQPALLPEAFTAFHQAFYAPRGPGKAPGGGGGGARSGGCKGLQDEMSVTSGAASSGAAGGAQQAPVVMYRQCIHELTSAALSLGGRPGRLLLKGPAGAGKSCALAALVERARADKWLVVYLPSATALVRGGYFEPRTGAGGCRRTWDTLLSAQHILLGMQRAHGDQLQQLPASLPASQQLLSQGAAGGSLADLVTKGLSTDSDGALAVDSALALVSELCALASPQQPVLIAIDDYNALYGQTDYGVWSSQGQQQQQGGGDDSEGGLLQEGSQPGPGGGPSLQGLRARRLLRVDELTLAGSLRLLAAPGAVTGSALVVGAESHSIGVAKRVRVPVGPQGQHRNQQQEQLANPGLTGEYYVPRYTPVEVAHALHRYYEAGAASTPPSKLQVLRLLALTNGNGAELRRLAARLPLAGVRNDSAVHAIA